MLLPACRYASTTSHHNGTRTPEPPSYDLIVVGYGLAGASAALAAAEAGASVLILDCDHGGGASILSGGVVYSGGGTRYQLAAGFHDTPDNMFNYLKLETGNAVSDTVLRKFCEGSVERLEWLEKHGVRFDARLCPHKTIYPTDEYYLYFSGNEKSFPYRERATPVPRGHRTLQPGFDSGKSTWMALAKSVNDLGISFRPLSRVNGLERTDDGRSFAVHYKTIDQSSPEFAKHKRISTRRSQTRIILPSVAERYHARAEALFHKSAEPRIVKSKSVLLAAGGFAFNPQLRSKYLPAYTNVLPLGTESDDGTGISLGKSMGGSTSHMDKMSAWRFLTPPSAFIQGVAVSGTGERVAAEDLYGATFTESLIHRFGGRGWLILDASIWAMAKEQLKEQVQWPMKMLPFSQIWWAHKKASSLGALAEKIGVEKEKMLRTVEEYNVGVQTKDGDPLRKSKEYCVPVIQPPFYAIDISISKNAGLTVVRGITLGGLRVDGETGIVLDEKGAKIEGLYAAGRNAVGICSNSYVSGLSLADCVFSGRRAGEHAAKVCAGSLNV